MSLKDINTSENQSPWDKGKLNKDETPVKTWLRQTSSKTYLLDVAEMEELEKVYLKDTGDYPYAQIELKDMQAALNAQYGVGVFRAESHGSAKYIRRLK